MYYTSLAVSDLHHTPLCNEAITKFKDAGECLDGLDSEELHALSKECPELRNDIQRERQRRKAEKDARDAWRHAPMTAPAQAAAPAAPVVDDGWIERLVDGHIKAFNDHDLTDWDAAVAESPSTPITLEFLSLFVVHPICNMNQKNRERNTRHDASDARINGLEARPATKGGPAMIYREIWNGIEHYDAGSVVTVGGSMWHAKKANFNMRPGSEAAAEFWTLCVKHGADGKPGRDGRDAR